MAQAEKQVEELTKSGLHRGDEDKSALDESRIEVGQGERVHGHLEGHCQYLGIYSALNADTAVSIPVA